MARAWEPGTVLAMLDKAGADACRPEDLPREFGLREGRYHLSPEQAQAILDLRLHRLTGLEHEKLLEEYQQKLEQIADYLEILGDPLRLMRVIREELEAVRERLRRQAPHRDRLQPAGPHARGPDPAGRARGDGVVQRLRQVAAAGHLPGAAPRRRAAARARRCARRTSIEHLLVANSHHTILCFSNRGRVFWLKVYEIPVASRGAKGRPLVNLLRSKATSASPRCCRSAPSTPSASCSWRPPTAP